MTLEEWMASKDLDDDAVAKSSGIDRSTISRLRRGKSMPSRIMMGRLMKATDGAVMPNDWMAQAAE